MARRDQRSPAERRARERRGVPSGVEPIRLNPEAVNQLRNRLPGCLLATGIFAAPFVGLLYDVDLALGIAVVALAAASYLALDSRRVAPPELQGRLRTVAIINGAIAGAVLLLLILRLTLGVSE